MSGEEDVELRDLVAQTLETNGVLGKLKAQLRASVFLALDEQNPLKDKVLFQNQDFQRFASSKEGHEVLYLVREFLEFFKLEYSLAVFDAETDFLPGSNVRSSLLKQIGLTECKTPLISKVLEQFKNEENDQFHISSTKETQEFEKKFNADQSKNTLSNEASSDDDSFFFDSRRAKDIKSASEKKTDAVQGLNSEMSSLAGLPSLTKNDATKNNLQDQDALKARSSDEDDDYEADFQLSNVTPLGQTPRSARSDVKTIETEEISEEIEEELMKSDASQLDDLTTDRTISSDSAERVGKADYMEDIHS